MKSQIYKQYKKVITLLIFILFGAVFMVNVETVSAFSSSYGRVYTEINGQQIGLDGVSITSRYTGGQSGPTVTTKTPNDNGPGQLKVNGGNTEGGGAPCEGAQYINVGNSPGWFAFVGGGPFCAESGFDCGFGLPVLTPQTPPAALLASLGLPPNGRYDPPSITLGDNAGNFPNNATFGNSVFKWIPATPPSTPSPTPQTVISYCPVPAAVPNVRIECPFCNNQAQ